MGINCQFSIGNGSFYRIHMQGKFCPDTSTQYLKFLDFTKVMSLECNLWGNPRFFTVVSWFVTLSQSSPKKKNMKNIRFRSYPSEVIFCIKHNMYVLYILKISLLILSIKNVHIVIADYKYILSQVITSIAFG